MIKYHEMIYFTSSTTPLNKDKYFPWTPNQLACDQLMASVKLAILFEQCSIDPLFSFPLTTTNHCMLGNHLCLDECPSFEAEIIKNQAVVPSSQEPPLPRPCRFNRQLDHLTHTESQEPWSHNGQWAVYCILHTNNSHIVQNPPSKTFARLWYRPQSAVVSATAMTPGQPPSECNQTSAARLIFNLPQ